MDVMLRFSRRCDRLEAHFANERFEIIIPRARRKFVPRGFQISITELEEMQVEKCLAHVGDFLRMHKPQLRDYLAHGDGRVIELDFGVNCDAITTPIWSIRFRSALVTLVAEVGIELTVTYYAPTGA